MRQLVVNSLWKIRAGVLAYKDELILSDKQGLFCHLHSSYNQNTEDQAD